MDLILMMLLLSILALLIFNTRITLGWRQARRHGA
jgi:hypothetical protein